MSAQHNTLQFASKKLTSVHHSNAWQTCEIVICCGVTFCSQYFFPAAAKRTCQFGHCCKMQLCPACNILSIPQVCAFLGHTNNLCCLLASHVCNAALRAALSRITKEQFEACAIESGIHDVSSKGQTQEEVMHMLP